MNGEPYGIHIERFIGFISVVSCCAFIILTYKDWSREAECCGPFYEELDRINEYHTNLVDNWEKLCEPDCRVCANDLVPDLYVSGN